MSNQNEYKATAAEILSLALKDIRTNQRKPNPELLRVIDQAYTWIINNYSGREINPKDFPDGDENVQLIIREAVIKLKTKQQGLFQITNDNKVIEIIAFAFYKIRS